MFFILIKCFLLLIIIFGVICLLTKDYQDLFFYLSERDLKINKSILHLTLLRSVEKLQLSHHNL